jgi:hypothetical protein
MSLSIRAVAARATTRGTAWPNENCASNENIQSPDDGPAAGEI